MSQFHIAADVILRTLLSIRADPLGRKSRTTGPLLLIFLAAAGMSYVDLKRLFGSPQPQAFQVVGTGQNTQALQINEGELMLGLIPFVATILGMIALVWLAVQWHRARILASPTLGGLRPLLRYVTYVLPLALLLGGALIAPALWLGYLSTGAQLSCWALAMFFVLRLSPALPAAAIGVKLGYGPAWRRTTPLAGACALLMLFRVALYLLVGVSDVALFQPGVPWAIVILSSALLITLDILISIALLTELYLTPDPTA